MPIKGLTDTAQPFFPRIGKLRKGGPRPKDGRAPGRELSYFRFTSDNPKVVAAFQQTYKDEPQEIDVYLPYRKIRDAFSTWKEEWRAGGLVHRCDGETCTVWLTEKGTYSRKPKPCPGGCKEVGRLSVVIPALLRAGFVGYVTMETGSLHDIISIQSSLLATVEHRGTEDLRGIGFVLRRVQREISTPTAEGKRVRRKKWMVELQPAARWVTAQLERTPMLSLPPAQVDEIEETVNGEVVESEPATESPERPHWIDKEAVRKRFWVWTRDDLGLTDDQIYEALGIEHIHDFQGSMSDAKRKIEAWVNDQLQGNDAESSPSWQETREYAESQRAAKEAASEQGEMVL